jgi:hypothetical protein
MWTRISFYIVACVSLLTFQFMSPGAQAQFVCESTAGGSGGATATGAFSVACGTNANAVGGSTAVGFAAGSLANPANEFNSAIGPSDAGSDMHLLYSGWQ